LTIKGKEAATIFFI